MKNAVLSILMMMCSLTMWAQQVELSARVVASDTGEPLPYAHVSTDKGLITITNDEGDFTAKVEAEDEMVLSYVGFEPFKVSADKMPKIVKLKPMSKMLRGVTAMPWENIIMRISKKLNKEGNKYKDARSQYFCRMTTSYVKKELFEAFLEARSLSSLKNLEFVSGRHGKITQEGLMNSSISNMNFHHSLELGMLQQPGTFWNLLITPLTTERTNYEGLAYYNRLKSGYKSHSEMWNYAWSLKNYYDIEAEELEGNDGERLYKISFSRKADVENTLILVGTMYVDAKTLDILKFEGMVENMMLEVSHDFYRRKEPLTQKIHVNYTHGKGYTEVSSIASTMSSRRMKNHAVLFNVDDLNLDTSGTSDKKQKKHRKSKGKRVGENMLATVDEAGFNEMLWAHSNIVKRTDEEEALAGMPNQTASANELEKLPETKMERLVDRLERFGRNVPQEKVYVHMDNTCYFLGDTIWFSAYTRQTNDGKPSQISGVLYVELFNQEGYLVERKIVEMTSGRGYGNFVLDTEHNYGGYYELRAYTRWQLNWGLNPVKPSAVADKWFMSGDMMWNYYRDYDKLYSRVFPVYDAPKTEGNYTEEMTERRMRRVYSKDPHKRELQLMLFPEGGNLIEGLPCRVAFEARWDDGQEVEGSLVLRNEEKKVQSVAKNRKKSRKRMDDAVSADGDKEIRDIKTENRGRGVFDIVPSVGEDRNVVLTTNEGKTVKAKLPVPLKEGVTLRVSNEDSILSICVMSSESLSVDSLGLTIMHEGVLEKFVQITEHRQMIAVPVSELKTGVNQVTVFDVNGQVLADRLTFVRGSDQCEASLTISGVRDTYAPYESVELDIQGLANSQSISLSVKDASHRDVLYDNASMLTEMLLTSEIKGFVENPEWFFNGNDYIHNRALDLLMMTQGWRRFSWSEMAQEDAWEIVHPAERTPIITGKVYDIPEGYYEDMARMKLGQAEQEKEMYDMSRFGETDDNNQQVASEMGTNSSMSNTAFIGGGDWKRNLGEIMTNKNIDTWTLSELEYYPGRKNVFNKKSVRLHAELVSLNKKTVGTMDIDIKDGNFKIQLPDYYGECIFFLSAADTLKWKGKPYTWIQLMTDDEELLPEGHKKKYRVLPSEFSIRVNFPYPRFVKPYGYYQTHLNYSYDPLLSSKILADGSIPLNEVRIWAKHGALHSFEDSVPTRIVDAYDAYNETLDAGFIMGTWWYIARNMVGDYGLDRPYVGIDPINGYDRYYFRQQFGYDVVRRSLNGLSTDPDSAYMRSNLQSSEVPLSGDLKKWDLHSYIDKYVLYTDYQPRMRGDQRYLKNLPNTDLAVYPHPQDERRPFYRDRRYILPGFSFVNEFYSPDYSKRKLDEKPKDYRRTLYWNPMLRLNAEGRAKVRFYNNSTQHKISIDAQGMSWDGSIYKSEVEAAE